MDILVGKMNFRDIIIKKFDFLITQYHFVVSPTSSLTEVIFESQKIKVRIFVERGQIFIDIGTRDGTINYDMGHIIKAIDPEADFLYAWDGELNAEMELTRLAKFMLKYCSKILWGDFSIKERVEEYFQELKMKYKRPHKIGHLKLHYPDDDHKGRR